MKLYLSQQVEKDSPRLKVFFRVITDVMFSTDDEVHEVVRLVNKIRQENKIAITAFQISNKDADLYVNYSSDGDCIETEKNAVEAIQQGKLILMDKNGVRAILKEKDAYVQKIHPSSKNIVVLTIIEKGSYEKNLQILNHVSAFVSNVTKGKVSSVQSFEKENKELSKGPKQTVMSGVRPTGTIHLGNYLGAVQKMVDLQNTQRFTTLYMVANMSAITTPYDKKALPINTRNIVMDYLACGVDPEKSIIFRQSDVSEHVELAYLLSSVYSLAKLQHLPTFKDKVKQHPHDVTLALLSYPILMASGILLYKSHFVPVGIDQEPHLEVAREIARKMNQSFCLHFPEPKRFINDSEYVPSLSGNGKMSKSVPGSFINLNDSFSQIRNKIAAMPTSTEMNEDMTQGVKTLFDLMQLFSKKHYEHYVEQYKQKEIRFKDMKEDLSKLIYEKLLPIQNKRQELVARPKIIDEILVNGAKKARSIAKKTMEEVKENMGLCL